MSITPVLFIIFNRPENTQKVFEKIKEAKPEKLFVAADGPRAEKQGEDEICRRTREIIKVDWECELHTLFSDKNKGCKYGVSSAIEWFFDHVEEGIILEDDCVPVPDFFSFSEQMLQHYRDDKRVMMISGSNFLFNKTDIKESYFFSNYYSIWGWATWKWAWKHYDIDMNNWEEFRELNQMDYIFSDKRLSAYYHNLFELIRTGWDTWDIQWWYALIFQNGLCIVPRVNLISNIGLEGTHSHTQGNVCIEMPTGSIRGALIHPEHVTAHVLYNKLTYLNSHAAIDLFSPAKKIKRKIPVRQQLKNKLPSSITTTVQKLLSMKRKLFIL